METRKPEEASRSPQSAPAGPPPTMAMSRIRRPGSGERKGCCQEPSSEYSTEDCGGHGRAGAVAQSVSAQALAEREGGQKCNEDHVEQRVCRARPHGDKQNQPHDPPKGDEKRHPPGAVEPPQRAWVAECIFLCETGGKERGDQQGETLPTRGDRPGLGDLPVE